MYVYTLLNNQFTLKVEVKHRTEFLAMFITILKQTPNVTRILSYMIVFLYLLK